MKYIPDLMRDISALASAPVFLLISIAALLINHTIGIYLFLSFVISFGITVILRTTYPKERPNKEKIEGSLLDRINAASFPSLHAQRAIILWSLTLHTNNILIMLFGLLITVLILASRLYLKKHTLYDVVVGAALGAAICVSLF